MGRLTLVLGGTKSGKTRFAEERATRRTEETQGGVAYLATAQAFDKGMSDRIARHQASRPAHWSTWEEPIHASRVLPAAATGSEVIILDCLTLLATNIILSLGEEPDRETAAKLLRVEVAEILSLVPELPAELIIVSNYVEVGVIPATKLGALFQDLLGESHQTIAHAADKVVMMIAGLPQHLK